MLFRSLQLFPSHDKKGVTIKINILQTRDKTLNIDMVIIITTIITLQNIMRRMTVKKLKRLIK